MKQQDHPPKPIHHHSHWHGEAGASLFFYFTIKSICSHLYPAFWVIPVCQRWQVWEGRKESLVEGRRNRTALVPAKAEFKSRPHHWFVSPWGLWSLTSKVTQLHRTCKTITKYATMLEKLKVQNSTCNTPCPVSGVQLELNNGNHKKSILRIQIWDDGKSFEAKRMLPVAPALHHSWFPSTFPSPWSLGERLNERCNFFTFPPKVRALCLSPT